MQDTGVLPTFRRAFSWFPPWLLSTPRRAATAALALIAVMGVVTGLLARDYEAVRERLARDEFAAGTSEADVRPDEAAEHFRAALALDRENPEYRRSLALVLLQLGRTGEAETHLIELLQTDPIDGEANLLRARVARRRGALADAETFYQRAIYGRWTDEEGQAERIAARFELVDLLERMGARIEARAELLRVQAELPDVPVLQRELARRLLALSDPAQAAEVLQRVVKQHPADASTARALTEALLQAGRFREARDAASRALALDPDDRATRRELDRINEALSLDPTVRGLSASTRMRRSGELLARVLQDLTACLAAATPPSSIDWTDLRTRAEAAVAAKAPSPRDADTLDTLTEQRLAVTEELWRLRVSHCGTADTPVAWIADRLTR